MKESKLIAACEDLTKALKLEPKIETKEKAQMKNDIKEAAKLLTSKDMGCIEKGTIAVMKELQIVLPKMSKDADKEEKKEKTDSVNRPSEKKEKKEKIKKVGVIASIVDIVGEKQPISLERIVGLLCKKFPDRIADGMRKTAIIQLSSGLKKKGYVITKSEKGLYSLSGKPMSK